MKKQLFYLMLLLAVTLVSCEKDDNDAKTIVLNLEYKFTEPESEWIGDTSGTNNEGTFHNKFDDNFFVFDNYFTPAYYSWGGFMYTNKSDVTTAGYTNNSAITGKANTGKVYLTANTNNLTPAVVSFKDGQAHTLTGMYVTNSTYAYFTMKNGNDFARKFEDGDWFKLEIYGKDIHDANTRKIDIFLADYRDGKTELLNTWKWIPLDQLGEIKSLHFTLSSTDNGDYGMNTPSYFCMDDITAIQK